MDSVLIVYKTSYGSCNAVTFKDSDNAQEFTKMLREFGYTYEYYKYTNVDGYIRIAHFPANV